MTKQEYSELPFRQFTTLLRRQWKVVAAFLLVGMAVAVLIGIIIPPRYTANAQLLVGQSKANPAESRDNKIVETHVALLMSPTHLRRVHESLSLDICSGLVKPEEPPLADAAQASWRSLRSIMSDWLWFLRSGPEADLNTVDGSKLEAPEMFDFEELRGNLNVYKERLSRVITVTFTSIDPQTAATIANRVAGLYVQMELDRAQAEYEKAQMHLAERVPAARAELEIAEAAVREYRLDSGLVDVRRLEVMDRQIAELKRQLEIDYSEVAEYDAHLALLKRYREQEGGLSLFFEALKNPRLAKSYRPQMFAAAGMAGSVRDRELPPGRGAIELDRAREREQVGKMADAIFAQLALDRSAIEARGHEIRQHLESLEHSREATRKPEQRLRELESKAAAAAQLYESLLQRKTELAAQGAVPADARLVSVASVPELPSSPAPILFLLPALVAAGITGGFTSIVIEQLDRRLRSARDIDKELGVSCIGLVPKVTGTRRLAPQRILIDSPFDPYTEAIRSVVTAALMPLSHEPVVFPVTSSRRGEGTTTLAISFAAYAALLGRRVLLIDLNFHAPGVSRALNESDDLGIIDVLNGRAPHDVIKNVAELGIDYLPLSKKGRYPLAILSTDRLPNMLDDLKQQYDCIVLDSAPLLGTTEARLFAFLADKVIFAVKWGATDQDVARRALHQLSHAGIDNVADVVCAVLTEVDMRKHIFCRYAAAGDSEMRPRDVPLPRIPIRHRPSRQSSVA